LRKERINIMTTNNTTTTTVELNKHDLKALETITPYVAKLQEFVQANIIDTKTSGLPAAKVQEQFFKQNDGVTLSPVDFIYGFRVAVKAGSITGIEGVKKAGYRMVGFEKTTGATKEPVEKVNPLTDVVEALQVTVDKHIQGENKMTAAMLFEKYIEDNTCQLGSTDFVNAFRGLVKDGKIVGLKNAYRAGYKRDNGEEEVVASSSDNEVEDVAAKSSGKPEILLTGRLKAVGIDSRNWQLQRLGSTGKWKNDGYCASTSDLFQTLARKAFDDELKNMGCFTIQEFADKLEQAEERIADMFSCGMTPAATVPVEEVELSDN
jgi:hypothetical protein